MTTGLPPRPDRRDADRDQGGPHARRAPQHGPRLERRRSAALLPDQSARRSALSAGRPAAVPGRRRASGHRRVGPCPAAARSTSRPSLGRSPPIAAGDVQAARRSRRRTGEPPRIGPRWTVIGADLRLLDLIARLTLVTDDLDEDLGRIAREIRVAGDAALVAILELRGERLTPLATATDGVVPVPRLMDLPRDYGVLGRALDAAPVRLPGGGRPGGRPPCPSSPSRASG